MHTQKKNNTPEPAVAKTEKPTAENAEEKNKHASDSEEVDNKNDLQDWPDLDSLNQRSQAWGPAGFNRLLGCGG